MPKTILCTYEAYSHIHINDVEELLFIKWEDVEEYAISHGQMDLFMKDGSIHTYQLPQPVVDFDEINYRPVQTQIIEEK